MKRFLTISLLWLGCLNAAWALPQPPEVVASAYTLADAESGQILASRAAHERVEPGGLVKLMNAYLVFQAVQNGSLSWRQPLRVPAQTRANTGARILMLPEKPMRAEAVLQGMLTLSANDAALTLADAVSGSEKDFVRLMNQTAQRLGMKDTHFANATGDADAGQYTTAADMLLLAQTIVRQYPQYLPRFGQHSFTYDGITQPNRNLLVFREMGVDGMATGFTLNSGYNLVAHDTRNGRSLILVLMGTESTEARAAAGGQLLNWARQHWYTAKVYPAGKLADVAVYRGTQAKVPAGFSGSVYISVPAGQSVRLRPVVETVQPARAPVRKGQILGKVVFYEGSRAVAEQPVTALASVEEADRASWWTRFTGWLKNLFA